MRTSKKAPQDQLSQIMAWAEDKGLTENYFFTTTFERYNVQIQILKDLEKSIAEYGPTVTKEYVKGRQNLMSNPAITEYNKTATAANGTIATLLNIVKTLPAETKSDDALSEFMND